MKNSIFWGLLSALLLFSCGNNKSHFEQIHEGNGGIPPEDYEISEAKKLVNSLLDEGNYQRALQVVDCLEKDHVLSAVGANYFRGIAYSKEGQLRTSEWYWQKNMVARDLRPEDLYFYYETAASLSNLLVNKNNYEGALRVALPAVTKMEETNNGPDLVHAILHESIGRCQLSLGSDDEAAVSYALAFKKYLEMADADSTAEGLRHAVIDAFNTALSYQHAKHYSEELVWTKRTDSLLVPYRAKRGASDAFAEHVHTRLNLQYAIALQALGLAEEAAAAYKAYEASSYGQSSYGRIDATAYLVKAKRYEEAADNYRELDEVLNEWGIDYSLDNIRGFLARKFQANVGAGRKDSALAVATHAFEVLDSAIERAKLSDAAELAIVYETHQKETEIAHHQANLSRQRLLGTVAVSLLVTSFFIFYILYRRRAQRRLQATFNELQTAYDQLDKTTAAKERIESELRIAREIQKSMVPSVFPDRPGIDLYASMQPAREVGGDLYDYVLLGDSLYFCVGDVSGKGVPASLVMAQTTRLFHSLATQEKQPAQIAQCINAEMTDEKVTHGMFVTMFIGLLNLSTGRLVFCNAGHNPPVLGGDAVGGTLLEIIPNAPVGLWPDLVFEEEEIESIKGRPLFVYTDGLTEAENADLQQFGEERMLETLRRTQFRNSRQVIEVLREEVERHRNGEEPNDDLTMLCLRIDL
ncbi:MAG: serine/threonine-protein phosphatase [Prevotella sp.]|jgi:serine phosphatase RsbU (regulator of sigma subunit)|nr:serine/threonine-protein phosphatase [Prevotella sp.]